MGNILVFYCSAWDSLFLTWPLLLNRSALTALSQTEALIILTETPSSDKKAWNTTCSALISGGGFTVLICLFGWTAFLRIDGNTRHHLKRTNHRGSKITSIGYFQICIISSLNGCPEVWLLLIAFDMLIVFLLIMKKHKWLGIEWNKTIFWKLLGLWYWRRGQA